MQVLSEPQFLHLRGKVRATHLSQLQRKPQDMVEADVLCTEQEAQQMHHRGLPLAQPHSYGDVGGVQESGGVAGCVSASQEWGCEA